MKYYRLIIIEGLPCSGKSNISAYVADCLKRENQVCFVDEGSGNHPADYEFHALAPAGLLFPESRIVSLSEFSGDQLVQLLPYKIYDALPWEIEMPLMLEKWRHFVSDARADTIYVFNCVFLQNPMCETMMRFGFSQEVSLQYIQRIAEIIRPLNPMIVYLKNDDIAASVLNAASQRPGWLESVIDYHVQGAYGIRINAHGFDGYIRCLKDRQERELSVLSKLPVRSLIVDNPQRNWQMAKELIQSSI